MTQVAFADVAGETLDVGDQLGTQRQFGFIKGGGSGRIASGHSDSKNPNRKDDDKQGERNPQNAADDGAAGQPIFFRKRKAHTQKRKAAIPDMTASDCQYSKKFAPRRIIARMSEMK